MYSVFCTSKGCDRISKWNDVLSVRANFSKKTDVLENVLAVAVARITLGRLRWPRTTCGFWAALGARCGLMVVEENGQGNDHVLGRQEVQSKDRKVVRR